MDRNKDIGTDLSAALVAMHCRLQTLQIQVEDAQLALDELTSAVCRDLGVDQERLLQLFQDADKEA